MANKGAFINGDTGQTTSRELILLHAGTSFNSREEAKQYVADKVADETINSTYAQPVVVRYKDNGEEHIILGIGKGDNGYHYIDSAAIEHDLRAIIESIGTSNEGIDVVYSDEKLVSVKDEILKLNETIQNGDEQTVFDTVNTVAAKIDEILSMISSGNTVSENINESVGLNTDGTLPGFESTEYISDGETIKGAVETLDEALAGVQAQVTSNKVASADNSIVVVTDETGTDLSVNADGKTVLIGNDGKVATGLWLKKYDEDDNIGPNLLAVYKLVDKNGDPIEGSSDVEIPKDSSFVNAVLGTEDIYVDPSTGEIHDPGKEQGKKVDVLFLVYINNESKYIGVQIPLGDFLQEAEFKDGFNVVNNEVYVKLDTTAGSDSAKFLYIKAIAGENGAIALSGITEAITDAVAAEQARAEGVEATLQGNIDAEQARAEGKEEKLRKGAGLTDEYEYNTYTTGAYISGATSIHEATTKLDDAVKDIQEQVIKNHIEGENAIVVDDSAEDKTVVSLKVGDGDVLLTNDSEGLHSTIDLVPVTGEELRSLGADVREAYKLTGVGNDQIGAYVKIYNNSSSIYSIAVGDMGDTFATPITGTQGMETVYPDGITSGATGVEAIRVIYKTDRIDIATNLPIYAMTLVDVDDFLQNDEFKDGLETGTTPGSSSTIVKVKIDDASETFLTVSMDGVKLAGVQDAIDAAVLVEKTRAEGVENRVIAGVGLDENGNYITKSGTAYLDGAHSVEEEIAALDAAAKANKIEGDKAIVVTPSESGTTVSLKTKADDKLLTNDENGLYSTIDLVSAATTDATVREAWKLIGVNGEQIGATINIYKDAKVYSIALGDMGDVFDNYVGDPKVTDDPEDTNIVHGTTGQEALRVIELRNDGLYEMKLINLDEFLQNDEFKEGLETGTTGSSTVVRVKIDENSEDFLTVGMDGVKLSGVQDAIDAAAGEVQDELDTAEAAVGLNEDGTHKTTSGHYTSTASTIAGEISDLDEKVYDIQQQVIANKVVGENAIVTESGETGTTISLKLKSDGILTNDSEGLYATLHISALTASEIAELSGASNIREAYKLVGIDGKTAYGEVIKIYKDSALYSVALGDMEDKFVYPIEGDWYHSTDGNSITTGASGEEALRLIYLLSDGTYRMTLINLETFIQENEFKDGLKVVGHEVSVKLDATAGSDSEKFLYMKEISGENGAVALSGITEAIQVETDRAVAAEDDLQGQIDGLNDDLQAEITRATGQEDTIEGSVGLDENGGHIPTSGHYTSEAGTIAEEISDLDEKVYDIQQQVTANKIFGENAIVVTTAETGTTVSLKLKEDNILSNDEDGLYATLNLVSAATANDTIREAWKLVGLDGHQIGETINIYKDEHLFSAELGKTDDRFANASGDVHHSESTAVVPGTTGDTAIRFIFAKDNGIYEMRFINLVNFIEESDISDGLMVDGHSLKVKRDANSEEYLSVSSDGVKVAGINSAIADAVEAEKVRAEGAEATLQEHIDAEEQRATGEEERIDNKLNDEIARAKAQEDTIEEAVGLATGGTYISKSGTNYLDSATSVEDEIRLLDIEAGRSSGETNAIETAVGLNPDGTHIANSGHYTGGRDSIESEIEALDTEAYRHSGETDNIEVGVGLNSDGSYTAPAGNYISGSTSVVDALKKLDAQAASGQNEVDAVETAVGLNPDGTYKQTRTRYTSGATSTYDAIERLDTQVADDHDEADRIENAVGLNSDGTYKHTRTTYTSGATSTYGAIETLDDVVKDIQGQVTGNKVVGDKAIVATSGETGTTISLKLVDDGILTNSDDGLSATLKIKALTDAEISGLTDASNVREAYKLVGKDDTTAFGNIIKVYKDSALYSVAIGDMDDIFTTSVGGDPHITSAPDDITSGTSGEEALRLIYSLEDGLYKMVLVSLENFLHESEFKDGLLVNGHEVSVKLDNEAGTDSAKFLYMKEVPGGNGAIALSGITEAMDGIVEEERERAIAEEQRIEGRLNDEITSARTEEARIEAKLDNEITSARTEEARIEAKLDNEITSARTEEARIEGRLDNEIARAEGEEERIEDKLDAEITSARTEEARIETKLDDEIDRATTQENTIEASVGLAEDGSHIATSGNYTSGASTIAGEIAALDAQAKNEQDEIDAVEAGAGLATDGSYVPYAGGQYIASAENITDATEKLDDAVADVQAQITANKIYGENAIEVTTAATGTTVGLKLKGDGILTNNSDGLYATLSVVKLSSGDTQALGENVREAYKVVGIDGETQLGEVIKVYKDSALADVALGDMGDEFSNPTTDKYHSKDMNVNSGHTGQEALRFIYLLTDGTYEMALINLESFLHESEFEDGLEVNNHVVKVKIDAASETFLTVGPNGVKLSGVQDAIDAASGDVQAELDNAEAGVGLAADGSHIQTSGTYTRNATTIAGEIAALDAQAVANQGETDTIETGVGLASDGSHIATSGNYTSAATTIAGEIAALDAQAKSEQDEIDRIETAAGYDADGNYVAPTGTYVSGSTSTKGALESLDAQAVANQAETDAIETGVGLAADGSHIRKTNGHYISVANTIAEEIEALDDEALRNAEETNAIELAVGLDGDGGYVPTTGSVTSGASSVKNAIELLDTAVVAGDNEDDRIEAAVGLDNNGDYVKPAGQYVSASTTVMSAVELLSNQAVANQTETDNIETGVGLNADGTYKRTTTNYTSGATSTYNAIELLDVQVARSQSETDTVETAVGLNSDGTYNKTRTRYTSGETSVYSAIEALDGQVASDHDEVDTVESSIGLNADGTYNRTTDRYTSGATSVVEAIKALNDNLGESQSELDTAEIALGLNNDGTHAQTNGHYTSAATTMAGEIALLDAEAYRHSGETDTIETAVGLNADGSYRAPAGQYISASTSVMEAISNLNTQAETAQGEIDGLEDEITVVRNNVGLASDGTHIPSGGHYTSGAGTVEAEIAALDAEAYRNSGETDTIETAVGLAADGSYVTINGNYTSGATSVAGAILDLDSQVKQNADNIAINASDILKNKVYSDSNAIKVEHTDTEGAGTKISLVINSNDMILSQDSGLAATIHMEKVTGVTTAGTAYTEIQLLGKDRQIIDRIDASDFVADGFLESVEVVTRGANTYLVFTWNTAAGSRVTEIPVTDLFIPYTASTGVRLVDHDFRGVVDPTSEPFLSVGVDGFRIDGVQEVVEEVEQAILDINEKLVDIVSDNKALVITNEDQGYRKYRRLTVTLGQTLDVTESTLPEKNYLRIANDGLHTTIRPLTDEEIHGITNIDNIQ